ncbi:EamA family transporter [Rhizobium tropici]|uniref:EamA family transporter n=2 Tax=Rhizobium tropici TaxID=398 RepID=A0A5B0VYN0_RHITR|nr:EamA family transporter [Rhizobium tropici]KAA1179478.1 EamA family transporter [Rhizobium tropici]
MMSMRFSWLAVPVLNTLFQFFIKHGAEQLSDGSVEGWLWQALSSYWILAAIAVEIACFFIWMNVLAELDLSRAFPLSGVSYVLIIATGWFVFGERIIALQVIGSGLILLGVWLIAGANVAPGEQDDWHVKRDGLHSGVGKDG